MTAVEKWTLAVQGSDKPNVNNKRQTGTRRTIKILAVLFCLCTVLVLSFVLYRAIGKFSEFFRTSSPRGTYAVTLTGKKGRPPLGFVNEVFFEVVKNGESYIPKTYLHSGDTFDLSFEAGYPNHRWISENVLQLYREEYFSKGKPDILIVANRTTEPIRYLRIQSIDKFLIFDLQTSSSQELLASPPRGDIKWVGAEGEFLNGRKIELRGINFKTRRELGYAFTYFIDVTDRGLVIESPHLEKYDP